MRTTLRLRRPRAALTAGLLVVVVAGCGTGAVGTEPVGGSNEVHDEMTGPAIAADQTSHPRWETVTTLDGDLEESVELLIAEEALQWRSQWRCDAVDGQLRVETTDSEGVSRVLTEAACPDEGESLSVETGLLQVDVTASGDWEIVIDQYVDTFLDEPPLPEMTEPGATIVAQGSFADVEREGSGQAYVYELLDGRLALRFEDFSTLASPDLFVWVSESRDTSTSAAIVSEPHTSLGQIAATYGHQNYVIPDGLTLGDIESIVIWCEPFQIAYTAAVLER